MKPASPLALALLAGAALGPPAARAAAGLELRPSTTTVVLGEPVPIDVEARTPAGFELSPATAPLENFAVLGFRRLLSREEGGEKQERFTLTVLPLGLGEQTLPALDFELRGPGGRTLKSPPVRFDVLPPESVRKGDKALRDLKASWVRVGPSWPRALLGLLLAAALFAAGLYLLRREEERPREPPLAPHVRALRDLDALEASGFADPRAAYERLSIILKTYLEGRFGFPALYLTTRDLAQVLKQAEFDRSLQADIRSVLTQADLVKFAKELPPEGRPAADLAKVRGLVSRTAPGPAPAPAAEAA